MTIGIRLMQERPIQAVGQAFQADSTTLCLVSTTLVTTPTGGLLHRPLTTLGNIGCSTTMTISSDPSLLEVTAFLLVASGIKNLTYEIFTYFFVLCLYAVSHSSS